MKTLIVDDDPFFLELMKSSIMEWGNTVVSASDGNEAWEILQQKDSPWLVLLDWVMPGINGIELCKKIKKMENASYLYVIFLTGKNKKEDIVKGLEAGGDDFVTKPFDPMELKTRLEVGTRILKYKTELKEKNEQLANYASHMETLANERARQLVHADRMATLGVMSAGIAHEINNQLTPISLSIQTFKAVWPDIRKSIQESLKRKSGNSKKLDFILGDLPEILDRATNRVKHISSIVHNLGLYARHDKGERSSCSINNCIKEALQISHNALKHHVKVEKHFAENMPEIKANAQQIEQVLINLFVNAAQAMEVQGKGIIKVITQKKVKSLLIAVEDTGPGIPEEKIEQIWDPFYTSKKAGKGTGLGLSISQEIIKDHGGTISAENNPAGGARFFIELPIPINN